MVLGIAAAFVFAAILPPFADADPGDLDPSFGDGGIARTDGTVAQSVAIAPDGRIVVAGTTYNNLTVLRYLPDGSRDPSFDDDGALYLDSHFSGPHLALAPDGGILVAGSVVPEQNWDSELSVHRLTPEGKPDPAFGDGDGVARFDFSPGQESVTGMELLPDGDIAIAAQTVSTDHATADFVVARLDPSGDLDPAFGDGGFRPVSMAKYDVGGHIAPYPDGRIAILGRTGGNQKGDPVIVRLLADGSKDPSFGSNGRKRVTVPGPEEVSEIALGYKGGLVVAMERYRQGIDIVHLAIVSLGANGAVDRRYGDGIASIGVKKVAERVNAVARTPTGELIVAGSRAKKNIISSPSDFLLARFDRRGELDPTFGDGGIVRTDFGSASDAAADLELAPNGALLVAGHTNPPHPSGVPVPVAVLARYQN